MFDPEGNGYFEELAVNELFTTGAVPGVRFRKDADGRGTCIEDGEKSQAFHGRAAVKRWARPVASTPAAPANPTTKAGRKGGRVTSQDESTDSAPVTVGDSAPADPAPVATSEPTPASDPATPATSDDL